MLDLYEPLLEQLTIVHGPYELLHSYFSIADEIVREAGITIRIHSDFRRLVELNRRHQASWTPMSPMFDPSVSRLRLDTAFWCEAVDARGQTVGTHAQRLFVWPNTTLEDEVKALRVFYADPAPHIAAGEHVTVTAPIAKRITGRSIYGGALWTHPDWRQRGLTKILRRISRAYAYTRWAPDYIWAFIEPKIVAMGIPQATGPFIAEDGIRLKLAFRGEFISYIMWMTPETMLDDLQAVVDQATDASERLMEIPKMTRSPDFSDHGISTRS
jgi:hypothetical protein